VNVGADGAGARGDGVNAEKKFVVCVISIFSGSGATGTGAEVGANVKAVEAG
jgi:hypothetical protein